MNSEALEKFKEAKRLEKEALKMILPEEMVTHIEVISQEIKMMIEEMCGFESAEKKEDKKTSSKVKKVDIE